MKEKLFIKLSEFCLNKSIRLFGLLVGVSLLVFAFLVFQPVKPSTSQEKKDEKPVKEEQPIQEREPNYEMLLPSFLYDCTDKNKWIDNEVKFLVHINNPYFVRGDFDGNGNNDYAVIVESRKDKREGILVCFRNKETKAVLLGLDPKNPPPFWRLYDWDVETPAQVSETTDYKGKSIGIKPKGESIVMKWEDGIGVIYWDGKEFRWKQVILNDGG